MRIKKHKKGLCSDWQSQGQGFDSPYLHYCPPEFKRKRDFFTLCNWLELAGLRVNGLNG